MWVKIIKVNFMLYTYKILHNNAKTTAHRFWNCQITLQILQDKTCIFNYFYRFYSKNNIYNQCIYFFNTITFIIKTWNIKNIIIQYIHYSCSGQWWPWPTQWRRTLNTDDLLYYGITSNFSKVFFFCEWQ